MARAGDRILDSGDELPSIALNTVAHGTVTVPAYFAGTWGVLLVYRAHW